MLQISRPRDNAEVQVHVASAEGGPYSEAGTILRLEDLTGDPKALRLIDVIYSIESGCKVFLWWDDAKGDTLLLPLEGRGRLDLTPLGGISNPRNEGWTGHVQLSTLHETPGGKSFFLALEFAKLRV